MEPSTLKNVFRNKFWGVNSQMGGDFSQFDFDVLFTFSEDPCYCNGNGNYTSCQLIGICDCNPGYSGLADFSDGKFSCHIENSSVIALWGLACVACLISTAVNLPMIRHMLRKFFRVKKKLKAKGKTYNMTTHRGLIVVLMLNFLVHPLLCLTAMLRIFERDERVGLTWGITVLWTFVNVVYAITIHRYTTAIATAMLRAENSTKNYIAMGRWFGRWLMFGESFLTVFAYPQLIFVGLNNKLAARLCVTLYLVTSSGTYYILARWTRWVIKQLEVVFDEYEEHTDLRGRIVGALRDASRIYMLHSIVLFSLLAVPVLWTTHDYIQPILFWTIPYFTFRATYSVYLPPKKKQLAVTATTQ